MEEKMDETMKTAETPAVENAIAQGMPDKKQTEEKNKMSKKQIIGLVILSLIAIGGVLFGVYGMNSQNDQIAQLTTRAEDAEEKVEALEANKVTIVDPDENTVEISDSTLNYQNPVIKSIDPEEQYQISFKSSRYSTGVGEFETLHVGIMDGEIESCDIFSGSTDVETTYVSNERFDSSCEITGVDGKIFNVIEFGEGQSNNESNIGFIMTDGTVQYFPFFKAMESKTFAAQGKLRIDGFVTNAIKVGAHPVNSPVGGYGSTVFLLRDGSYVKYDETMLE